VKKASEQFRNIQVLKDLPADQLYPTMHFMADSLGVQCVDCHVGVPGQVDGEKDDKQMKRTARKMLMMTMEINKTNFDGQNGSPAVTCYTCHRGSRQPLVAPAKLNGAASKTSSKNN
jgi:Photosynthetic reaction centre cytochrome C subunit